VVLSLVHIGPKPMRSLLMTQPLLPSTTRTPHVIDRAPQSLPQPRAPAALVAVSVVIEMRTLAL